MRPLTLALLMLITFTLGAMLGLYQGSNWNCPALKAPGIPRDSIKRLPVHSLLLTPINACAERQWIEKQADWGDVDRQCIDAHAVH